MSTTKDRSGRHAQVKVTDHGDEAVHVERVEVVSATLVSSSAADKDSTVGAGGPRATLRRGSRG